MVRLIQFVGERLFIVLMLGFLFLFSADVFAGSFASGDSLLNETLLMKDDSAKVKKLINLAHKKINDNEMQEAIRIAQLSRVLSENIGYRFGEQMSYTAIGRCYSRLGDHENGLKHYTNANGIAIELNRSVANSFGNIGLAYQHLGNLAEALAFQLKALNIYENENDSLGMAKIYQYLGYLLTEQDKTAESIVYYKKSLAIFEINQKNSEVLSVLRLMGVAYRESGNLDSSLFFLNKAYELVKVNGSRRDQSDIFQTLASTHRVLCEFAADSNIAKYHFNESLRLNQQCLKWAEESGNENRIAKLYGNMGSLYSCRLQYTLAREKYNAALNLLLKSSDKADLRAIYLNLSDLDSLMAADQHFSLEERLQFARSSLVNTKLAEALRYEIINEESTHKLAELNTKYETERKDKEILLLNKEKDLQKVMLKEQLSTLLISNLRQQKDEQQIELLRKIGDVKLFELNAAQQEIEAQIMKSKVKENALVIAEKDMALKEKELSKEKWLRGSILTGSFAIFFVGLLLFNRYKLKKQLEHQQILINQRKSISADLHDDVGSTLSSISIYSEAIKNKLTHNEPERVMELVHKIGDNARETITNLSDIVWSINPANDKGEVVFSRMESFASFLLSSKNIQLNFNCDEALRKMEFSMETRQHLFLIFKEAINNAAKYSKAKQVNVAVSLWNGKIKMSIADNGVGFTVPKWSENGKSNGSIHNGGNGLSNIRLRTDQLKGNLDIRSSAEGTTLELVLPLT